MGKNNVWVIGDSNTGKTTLIKKLFDVDTTHDYKILIGGCEPAKSNLFYAVIENDIINQTLEFSINSNVSIYIDEIENCNFLKLLQTIRSLTIPYRIIVFSHHLPPETEICNYDIYYMENIISINKIKEYIETNYGTSISCIRDLTVPDYLHLLENHKELIFNSVDSIIENGRVRQKERSKQKSTVGHSICLIETPEYSRVNVIRIKY